MSLSLIGLPREVRNNILQILIQSHTTPPADASAPEDRTTLHDDTSNHWYFSIMHVKRLNRADFLTTLLVNHQLHAETLEVIELLPNNYEMHAMLVNEHQLWPTWVSAPFLSPRIERLHFSVKAVGTMTEDLSVWRCGDGNPPLITWYFYSLLERVLKVGPRLGHGAKTPLEVTIKFLDIEILSPGVPAEQLIPEGDFPDYDCNPETTEPLIIHPKTLVDFMRHYVRYLFYDDNYSANYGDVLLRRIGTIRLFLDDDMLDELDLGEQLQKCEFDDTHVGADQGGWRTDFNNWKADVYQVRLGLGFPVTSFEPESVIPHMSLAE